ncbi:unnamed protein product [Microthlaspi erraticum]|uniref:Transmembrane protein n=1 Tax=Microthlaspi erraticum TaxID=1685480 RepID=A0A6D2ILT5_9BRAS|nr:unnamed protein product [Microthlaspi erraticum]
MAARKINFHVLLLSFLLIFKVPSILGLSIRGTTISDPKAIHGHGGDFPVIKSRKLLVTNLEVDYSGDYTDGESSSSSSTPASPVPDYDDIYRRQGDVPSPGIGH